MELREGYKQTEAGLIPSDWEAKSLGELATFLSGGTPSRSNAGYWAGEIPWISATSLRRFYIYRSDSNVTKEAVVAGSKMAPVGSTLLLVRGSALHKEILSGLVTADVCFNQDVKALVPGRQIDPKFLTFITRGKADELLKLVSSAGNTAGVLDTKLLKAFEIPLPSTKAEQEAIAEALSDADSLIESLEQLIAKRRQIKQGAMQELLTGKKRLPDFSGEWEETPLSDACWFQEGPGVRNYQFTTSGVKLFNGTNIEKGRIDLEKTNRYISEREAYGGYSHFLADAGDVVIACSGVTVEKFDEKVAVLGEEHLPLCMNTSTMRFKVKPSRMHRDYLLQFLASSLFKQQIGGSATGSAQLNFGPSHVSKVLVSLPCPDEQTAIAEILSDIDEEIAAIDNKLNKARLVKQGMMQELLTGRIRLV